MIPTAALEASDHPDGLSFHRDRRRPGRRILVVDDNNEAAEVLAELVSLWGHEVRVANNGPEALRLVPDYHPDIVLLDIGMPGMDGFEVAQQIRAAHTAASLRLIALTGYGRDEDRIRSRQAGFDYHLTKPVEPGDLAILLESPKE